MNLKQSRTTSSIESLLNTFSGFALSLGCQWLVLVAVKGMPMTWGDNFEFALIMTAVSFARGFCWRRFFESRRISFALSPFLLAVLAEQRRQVEVEGFTLEHDDKYPPGVLARAGAAYLYSGSFADPDDREKLPGQFKAEGTLGRGDIIRALFPWPREWWKPRVDDRRRDLVRGCALGLAEGDKQERARRTTERVAT